MKKFFINHSIVLTISLIASICAVVYIVDALNVVTYSLI
jgi:hypothetical protein